MRQRGFATADTDSTGPRDPSGLRRLSGLSGPRGPSGLRGLRGPRRALTALCLTQIVGWGVLYYSFPVALEAINNDTGWSTTSTTAAFSGGLFVAAAAGIPVGRRIDTRGPRTVMTAGSVLATAALLAVAAAPTVEWFATAWIVAGLAQAATLYAPAFTALTRWYGPSPPVR